MYAGPIYIRCSFIFLAALLIWALFGSTASFSQTEREVVRLRLGVVTGDNIHYRRLKSEPFRAFLENELAIPVEFVPFQDISALMKAHSEGRVDYGVYSAAAYAQSWAMCRCIEPLAAPRAQDGGYGVRSVLLVAHDAPYSRLEDMHGKRVFYTGQASLVGHLVPARAMAVLSGQGHFIFGDAGVARAMRDSLGALRLGTADGVFGWEGAKAEGLVQDAQARGTVSLAEQSGLLEPGFARVIWRSEFIPHGPHAVFSDLPEGFKAKLRDILLSLDPASQKPVLTLVNNGRLGGEPPPSEAGASPAQARVLTAADIIDAIDPAFGGGFASVGHYDYLPVLNVIGWGTETIVPAWP